MAEDLATPALDPPLSRPGRGWWIALAIGGAGLLAFAVAVARLLLEGVGIWGIDIPYVWGFDLINYAFWIGIANGANLFAAILVLRRTDLHSAVSRFAGAIAIAAAVCAGLYPILHLGKPWLFYWLFPIPASFEVWPQFRSPLTWDFWAISAYTVATVLLWTTGLIPDLATLRDRAGTGRRAKIYGVLALGWRGSARQWETQQAAYRLIAAMMIPLIVVMQSTVSLEHAVMLPPGWHESSQPIHYVVTGLVSGVATTLLLALILRSAFRLERIIGDDDLRLLSHLLAAGGLATLYVYVAWAGLSALGESDTQAAALARVFGTYGPVFWAGAALSALLPQALWIGAVRKRPIVAGAVAILVVVGVFLDRVSIMVGALEHGHLPTPPDVYVPTWDEWLLLAGTVGLFFTLIVLFVRLLPVVSLHEVRAGAATAHAEAAR